MLLSTRPILQAQGPALAFANKDPTARARRAMVEEIAAETRACAKWLGRNHFDPAVLAALGKVPRHRFVPGPQRLFAYENRPLPIGQGQTISQPFIVALMTELAGITPGSRVLEVGTGCGYQTAILAELGAQIVSLERIPALAKGARSRLAELAYQDLEIHQGDGSRGWPGAAPYDVILVTAAAKSLPEALVKQLAPGGRLILPLERRLSGIPIFRCDPAQDLHVVKKDRRGGVSQQTILPVAFVPLVED